MIKILADTSCDLSDELKEKLEITWVPFSFAFGDEVYVDGVNITREEFYDKLASSSVIPKTSQISRETFEEHMSALLTDPEDEIMVFTLASTLSGTYAQAVEAARNIDPERIHVPDYQTVSLLSGELIKRCTEMIDEGKSCQEMVDILMKRSRDQEVCVTVPSLDHLKKGGRINFIESVIGGILNIKPIIKFNKEGKLVPWDKGKGLKQTYRKMVSIAVKDRIGGNPLMIIHGNNEEGAREVQELLEAESGEKVAMVSVVCPVIGCHLGAGAVAIAY